MRVGLLALLLTGVSSAQDLERYLPQLWSEEAVLIEDGRRRYCAAQGVALPEDVLNRLLHHKSPLTARAAASILMTHGRSRARLRTLLDHEDGELRRIVLPLATSAELVRMLGDEGCPLRMAVLHELEDRGELVNQQLLDCLDGADSVLGDAATGLLLNERYEFPDRLLADRGLGVMGKKRLIGGLGRRPRSKAVPWLLDLLTEDKVEGELRMLALAALPADRMSAKFARQILAAATDPQMSSAARRAALSLPPALADSLVGAVHGHILAGHAADALLPCLENVSALGERQLVSLVAALPTSSKEYVCQWLSGREGASLQAYIETALDGQAPLEPHLLRRAGPLLVSSARIDRVVAILGHEEQGMRQLAYHALTSVGAWHEQMLDFALAELGEHAQQRHGTTMQRVRMLLQKTAGALPEAVWLYLLGDEVLAAEPQVARWTLRILAKEDFAGPIESRLIALAGAAPGLVAEAAVRAIMVGGTESAVQGVWTARKDASFRILALSWLFEKPDSWLLRWLREQLALLDRIEVPDASLCQLRSHILHALARLQEPGAFDRLMRELPMDLASLRRFSKVLVEGLRDEHLVLLRKCFERAESEILRSELLQWVGQRPDLSSRDWLMTLHAKDPSEEVRLEAKRALLSTGHGDDFRMRLLADLKRPLRGDSLELAYELVGNMPRPTSDLDLALLARMLLLSPLAAPLREIEASLADDPRGPVHPLHLAIVDHLRRDPSIRVAPFADVVDELRRHPSRHALSGHRLGYFMLEIAKWPHLRRELAPAIAEVVLATLDPDSSFKGAARFLLAERAERAADWRLAAEHHAAAARLLLRRPLFPLFQRVLLGDESPVDGILPVAALAARADICLARFEIARGDARAARQALRRAQALGFGDDRTIDEIKELDRRLKK